MATVAKLIEDQLVANNVHWCPFFALIVEEALKKGWANQVIVDVVTQLHGLCLFDHDTFMQAQAGQELTLAIGIVTFLRNLPRPVLIYSFKVSYKNKKGGASQKQFDVKEENLSLNFIQSKIKSLFSTGVARLRITMNDDEFTEQTLQKLIELPQRTHLLHVENLQRGFSSFHNIKDALRLVGKEAKLVKDVEFFSHPYDLDGCDEEVSLAHKTIQVISPIVSLTGACEATKRIFIDPILVAAARIVKDIQMDVEHKIESPDADGPVDYIFKHGSRTVCVTEGKYEKQDSGVSQNIAQLVAVRESKKRKIDEISVAEDLPLYGIATTYIEWQFLELQGENVRVSKRYPCIGLDKGSVSEIIAKVAALLR